MKTLRGQLTGRLLVGGAVLLGASGLALHWQIREALTGEFDAGLHSIVQSLAALTEQNNGRVKLEFSGEDMPAFLRTNSGEVFLLRTTDGAEIQRSPSLGSATLSTPVGFPGGSMFFDEALPDGRKLRCEGIRFTPQPEDNDEKPRKPKVMAELIVGRNRVQLDHTLGVLGAILLIVGITTLGALIVLVRWGVGGTLVPLDSLGNRVAALNIGSLDTRFPIEPLPGELRPIARRLNELFARLEAAFARERRFTAGVSHELRTPLAELHTLAEVNLTTPVTPAESLDSWRDALATTHRMESLALRLLDLTRSEDPGRIIERRAVLLGEVLATAWRPWASRAEERGIFMEVAIPPEFRLMTDPTLLDVILGNLCANAAEHAPNDAPIRVTAAETSSETTLMFSNGRGELSIADLPHLFERFWRKDTARADANHYGLGLALASEFAGLLGGGLTAQISGEENVEFILSLPMN